MSYENKALNVKIIGFSTRTNIHWKQLCENIENCLKGK